MSDRFFLDTNIFVYALSLQHGEKFDNLRIQNPFL